MSIKDKKIIGLLLLGMPIIAVPIMVISCSNIKDKENTPSLPDNSNQKNPDNYTSEELNQEFSNITWNEEQKVVTLSAINLKEGELNIPTFATKGNVEYKVNIDKDFIQDLNKLVQVEGGQIKKANLIKKINLGGNVDLNLLFKDNENQFLFKGLKEVVFKEGIKEIPNYSFGLNPQLKTVTFPKTLKRIGIHAFKDTNITNLYIPKSVEFIGTQAFSNSGITVIEFEEGGTHANLEIESKAFEMNNIESITLPKNIKNITHNKTNNSYFFGGCPNLKEIRASEEVIKYFETNFKDETKKINLLVNK